MPRNLNIWDVLDKSDTDEAVCNRKVESGSWVAGAIRSLVNARDFKFECARILHETLLVPFLMYGSETILWKEKEKSRIRDVQMGNLRGFLGIRRMNSPECTNKGVVRSDEGDRRKD